MTDIHKVTLQDIFNAAWQRFIVEEAPPAADNLCEEYGEDDPHYVCKYLTKDGRKCAVGLCIPDGHPVQKMSSNFGALLDRDDKPAAGIFDESVYTLSHSERHNFQRDLHDGMLDATTGQWHEAFPIQKRREEYIKVAAKYNLNIPGEPNDECGTTQSDS